MLNGGEVLYYCVIWKEPQLASIFPTIWEKPETLFVVTDSTCLSLLKLWQIIVNKNKMQLTRKHFLAVCKFIYVHALTNLFAERTKFQIIRVMECFFSLKICVFHKKRYRQNLQLSFQKFFERSGKCCGGHAKPPSFTLYCRLTQINTTLFWKKWKHLSLICQKKIVRGWC